MNNSLLNLHGPSSAPLPMPTPRPPSHTISRLHAYLRPTVADAHFLSFIRRLELSPRAHAATPATYFQLFAGRQFASIVEDLIAGMHSGCLASGGEWREQDRGEMWALLGVTWEEMVMLQSLLEEEIGWLEQQLEEVMEWGGGMQEVVEQSGCLGY